MPERYQLRPLYPAKRAAAANARASVFEPPKPKKSGLFGSIVDNAFSPVRELGDLAQEGYEQFAKGSEWYTKNVVQPIGGAFVSDAFWEEAAKGNFGRGWERSGENWRTSSALPGWAKFALEATILDPTNLTMLGPAAAGLRAIGTSGRLAKVTLGASRTAKPMATGLDIALKSPLGFPARVFDKAAEVTLGTAMMPLTGVKLGQRGASLLNKVPGERLIPGVASVLNRQTTNQRALTFGGEVYAQARKLAGDSIIAGRRSDTPKMIFRALTEPSDGSAASIFIRDYLIDHVDQVAHIPAGRLKAWHKKYGSNISQKAIDSLERATGKSTGILTPDKVAEKLAVIARDKQAAFLTGEIRKTREVATGMRKLGYNFLDSLDDLSRSRLVQGLNKGLVAPMSKAYLFFANYAPMNAVEDVIKSALGHAQPGVMSPTEFRQLWSGVDMTHDSHLAQLVRSLEQGLEPAVGLAGKGYMKSFHGEIWKTLKEDPLAAANVAANYLSNPLRANALSRMAMRRMDGALTRAGLDQIGAVMKNAPSKEIGMQALMRLGAEGGVLGYVRQAVTKESLDGRRANMIIQNFDDLPPAVRAIAYDFATDADTSKLLTLGDEMTRTLHATAKDEIYAPGVVDEFVKQVDQWSKKFTVTPDNIIEVHMMTRKLASMYHEVYGGQLRLATRMAELQDPELSQKIFAEFTSQQEKLSSVTLPEIRRVINDIADKMPGNVSGLRDLTRQMDDELSIWRGVAERDMELRKSVFGKDGKKRPRRQEDWEAYYKTRNELFRDGEEQVRTLQKHNQKAVEISYKQMRHLSPEDVHAQKGMPDLGKKSQKDYLTRMEIQIKEMQRQLNDEFGIKSGPEFGTPTMSAGSEEFTVRSARQQALDNENGEDILNLPGAVKVGEESLHFHSYGPAQQTARSYMADRGIDYLPPRTYAEADPELGARVAQAYDEMPHNPNDPEVAAAYQAFKDETLEQYKYITERMGIKPEFYPEGADPYPTSPRQAVLDVRENKHMYVYPTESGFGDAAAAGKYGDHPLLEKVPGLKWNGKDVTYNDVFRFVHDTFGHIKEGVGFRASGEFNAWRQHAAMYSPSARRAMTAETHGQNSWVNFGPHGAKNRKASTAKTVFADQKAGLLPEWVSEDPVKEAFTGPRAMADDWIDKTRVMISPNRDDLTTNEAIERMLTKEHEGFSDRLLDLEKQVGLRQVAGSRRAVVGIYRGGAENAAFRQVGGAENSMFRSLVGDRAAKRYVAAAQGKLFNQRSVGLFHYSTKGTQGPHSAYEFTIKGSRTNAQLAKITDEVLKELPYASVVRGEKSTTVWVVDTEGEYGEAINRLGKKYGTEHKRFSGEAEWIEAEQYDSILHSYEAEVGPRARARPVGGGEPRPGLISDYVVRQKIGLPPATQWATEEQIDELYSANYVAGTGYDSEKKALRYQTEDQSLAGQRPFLQQAYQRGVDTSDGLAPYWYEDFYDRYMVPTYGEEDGRVLTALSAATSAQTPVVDNFANAKMVYEHWIEHGRNTDATVSWLQSATKPDGSKGAFTGVLKGKGVDSSHINNVRRALEGKDLQGRKVQNFFLNLMGDPDAVTVDTWMLKAFALDGFKTSGWQRDKLYDIIADAIRQEADKAGVTPREFQAAVWAGVRDMIQNGEEIPYYRLGDEAGGTVKFNKSTSTEVIDANTGKPVPYSGHEPVVNLMRALDEAGPRGRHLGGEFKRRMEADLTPEELAMEDEFNNAGVSSEVTNSGDRMTQVADQRAAANAVQDQLGFADKVTLQQLGIDPQTIDDPAVIARIQAEAPEIAAKLSPSTGPTFSDPSAAMPSAGTVVSNASGEAPVVTSAPGPAVRPDHDSYAEWARDLDEAWERATPESRARFLEERKKAVSQAGKDYTRDFPDYHNEIALDSVMKAIFPYWRYEAHRLRWLPESFIRYPWLPIQMTRYLEGTDDGYIPVMGGLEINPMRGMVLGGVRRMFGKDYPPQYGGSLGSMMGALDTIQRWGLYPGIQVSGPMALAESAAEGKIMGGEVAPPVVNSALATAQMLPVVGGTVDKFRDNFLHDRFREYYLRKELAAQGIDPDEATQEERESILRSAGWKELLESQASLFRYRPDEEKEYRRTRAQVYSDVLGEDEDVIRDLFERGERIENHFEVSPAQEELIKQQLEPYQIWASVTLPLRDPEARKINERTGEFWERWQGIVSILDTGSAPGMSPEEVATLRQHFGIRTTEKEDEQLLVTGKISGNEYRARNRERGALQAAIWATHRFDYKDVPVSDEDREQMYPDLPIEKVHPVRALINEYYSLRPDAFTDDMGEIDWDSYQAAREEVFAGARPEVAQEAQSYIQRDWTPTRKKYEEVRQVYNQYQSIPKYIGIPKDRQKIVDQVIAVASDMAAQIPQGAVDREMLLIMAAQRLGLPPAYGALARQAERNTDPRRKIFRVQHPEMSFFYSDIPHNFAGAQ